MSKYPEHDKVAAQKPLIDAVAGFLETLEGGHLTYAGQHLHLGIYPEDARNRLMPVDPSIASLLAQYFGIDQGKLEKEKRQMLDEARKAHHA